MAVETGIGQTDGTAYLSALKEDTELGLELLADILRNPAFPEDKIKLAKRGAEGRHQPPQRRPHDDRPPRVVEGRRSAPTIRWPACPSTTPSRASRGRTCWTSTPVTSTRTACTWSWSATSRASGMVEQDRDRVRRLGEGRPAAAGRSGDPRFPAHGQRRRQGRPDADDDHHGRTRHPRRRPQLRGRAGGQPHPRRRLRDAPVQRGAQPPGPGLFGGQHVRHRLPLSRACSSPSP